MKPLPHPIQVTFRNMQPSPAVATRVRREAAKLARYYSPIISCRVLIEAPHRHHRRGVRYHLRVEIGVPGNDIIVVHEPPSRHVLRNHDAIRPVKRDEISARHQDIYVAIRDAFDIARRRLEDHARVRRGAVKVHLPADAPLPV